MELLGYAHKSSTDDNTEYNIRLTQSMVGNLKERFFATRVCISTSNWTSTPFAKRDLKFDSKAMESLKYIDSCNHDICLISIDFAGLTIRNIDLVNLIEDNPAIKKIALWCWNDCIQDFTLKLDSLKFNLDNHKKLI
ncbi:unnamed protein product [Rhizopus stolonifer]